MADENTSTPSKAHRAKQAGPKMKKKKGKDKTDEIRKNPRAYTIQSIKKTARTFHRTVDLANKKLHIPLVDRAPLEPPPIVVSIVGPPKVGKTILLRSLIKNFTRQKISDIQGPVTVVSGKQRRLTFMECSNDINCMIDVAKVSDLVLLLIDASFGFEMEIFEFLNIAQVHGFPKIMGVLTHLDLLKNNKSLKKQKKKMKQRFWTEVYQGAKLFNLSGISHGTYPKTEIHNLGRFISVMKFRPLTWRTTHPYILADRVEDITDPDMIREESKCDRTICLYGYTRGAHLKQHSKIHVIGCGDFSMKDVSSLPDPCPLPEKEKKRSLNEKERLLYAPMSGVGGIVYDKDAVYIDLGGSQAGQRLRAEANQEEQDTGTNELVSSLLSTQKTIDKKMADSQFTIFKNSLPISSEQLESDQNIASPSEEIVKMGDGRQRRLAIFDDADTFHEGDSEDEEDEENVGEEDSGVDSSDAESEEQDSDDESEPVSKKRKTIENINDVEFEDSDEDGGDIFTAKDKSSTDDLEQLKKKLKEKIAPFMQTGRNRAADLKKLIYDEGYEVGKNNKPAASEDEEDDGDMIGGIFKVRGSTFSSEARGRAVYHQRDCSSDLKATFTSSDLAAIQDLIQNRFVTGKWSKSEDATQLLQDDDEELFGDFEDLETGDLFKGDENAKESEEMDADSEMGSASEDEDADGKDDAGSQINEDQLKTDREEKKKKLKEAFNNEYDDEQGGSSYYDELKESMSKQAQGNGPVSVIPGHGNINSRNLIRLLLDLNYFGKLSARKKIAPEIQQIAEHETSTGPNIVLTVMINQSEFEDMDDAQRVKYEGYRAGMYVRIEINKVPCEFVENFDPRFPVVIGGVLSGEDSLGFIQTRFKKHRWHDRILKNRDPLIVSIGWRRFQTIPLYSSQDHNGRYRSLKYTPEHLHCIASMYGPVTPPNTGILAVQSVSGITTKFRIAGTGVIINLDKSVQVVKKLKLTGTPLKIFKNTAFIKGMFNSALEVAKFEGATVRTVSGIRGQVKRALKNPPGSFRATFEDKILMSDIIFCRTWYPLQCPQFYNPVTSLLLRKGEKGQWQGMRTVGQLRKELGLSAPQISDSFYKKIERPDRKFNPLHIPDKLKKELPFKSKPKEMVKRKRKSLEQKRAVIMEPQEKKVYSLMQEIVTLHREKVRKRKVKQQERNREHEKKLKIQEQKREGKMKEQRKKIYRLMGQMEKKKEKQSKS